MIMPGFAEIFTVDGIYIVTVTVTDAVDAPPGWQGA
jgi:hypothetical protein